MIIPMETDDEQNTFLGFILIGENRSHFAVKQRRAKGEGRRALLVTHTIDLIGQNYTHY